MAKYFYKTFLEDIFSIYHGAGIPLTNHEHFSTIPGIQFLLTGSVILNTAINKHLFASHSQNILLRHRYLSFGWNAIFGEY